MSIIEARACSVSPHARGILLSVLVDGPPLQVACDVRLTVELAQKLNVSLRKACEGQRVIEWQAQRDARGE
jgi:hypothetical protein